MAEEVGGGEPLDRLDILDGLTRLVDKSLVIADDGEGMERYRLLETVRHYASDKLMVAGEATSVRAAHLRCIVDLASPAASGLATSDERFWLPRLDVELENIRAALAWGVETDPVATLRLAGDLMLYWAARGLFAEGRRWVTAGMAAGGCDRSAIEARAHGAASYLSLLLDDPDQVREHANKTIAIDKALGQPGDLDVTVSWATLDLADQLEGDDPDRSTSMVKQAIERADRSAQLLPVARAHRQLTRLAMNAGDLNAALALSDRSVELAQRLDNRPLLNRMLLTRCHVHAARNDLSGALADADVALSAANASGDLPGLASSSLMWTSYARRLGRFDEAAAMAHTAVRTSSDLGQSGQQRVQVLVHGASSVRIAAKDNALARTWLEEAVGIRDDTLGGKEPGRTAQLFLGEVCRLGHDLVEAEKWLVRVLGASASDDAWDRSARRNLALVAIERGDNASAHGYLLDVVDTLTCEAATETLANVFDAAAHLTCAQAEYRVAATLIGAADVRFAPAPAGRDPVYVATRDKTAELCEASLGPEAFAHAVADGGGLTTIDALALARVALGGPA